MLAAAVGGFVAGWLCARLVSWHRRRHDLYVQHWASFTAARPWPLAVTLPFFFLGAGAAGWVVMTLLFAAGRAFGVIQ